MAVSISEQINSIEQPADVLIGATAIYHNLPLFTCNKKHFEPMEKSDYGDKDYNYMNSNKGNVVIGNHNEVIIKVTILRERNSFLKAEFGTKR